MITKISLHRALAELKLIDKKLTKKTSELLVVGNKKIAVDSVIGVAGSTVASFTVEAKSQIDSIEALFKRKAQIKSKLIAANAVTILEVAGVKMTIAEAITKKDNISFEVQLQSMLKSQLRKFQATVEVHNSKVDANALELIKVSLGEGADKDSEQAKGILDTYMKNNSLELVDPIGVNAYVVKAEEALSAFQSEVDAALSEINATTLIEVED